MTKKKSFFLRKGKSLKQSFSTSLSFSLWCGFWETTVFPYSSSPATAGTGQPPYDGSQTDDRRRAGSRRSEEGKKEKRNEGNEIKKEGFDKRKKKKKKKAWNTNLSLWSFKRKCEKSLEGLTPFILRMPLLVFNWGFVLNFRPIKSGSI